jgi:hypothetical protein
MRGENEPSMSGQGNLKGQVYQIKNARRTPCWTVLIPLEKFLWLD